MQPVGTEPTRDEMVDMGEAAEETRLALAAQSGDAEAASVLGAILLRRGDLDGAEPQLRAATAAGDRAAANNLG
ncbi:sel1 repeat family protein, partial [Streptomyces sp. SID486]|nr:sel1 repeat family protein [Streptomyces sp. SID486]